MVKPGLGIIGCPLFLWFASAVALVAAEFGGLRGSVRDADVAAPLGNARVSVVEAMGRAMSNPEGLFTFDALPPGVYTVTVTKDGYIRKTLPQVVITAGQFTEVRVELEQEVVEMEEFVVRGFDFASASDAGLLQIRADSMNISDAIGADLMSKAGASTAAAALRLVVGTTVQDGKYVVIRGLADRYTVTLLNDTRLPTADSERRAVQLDQYPAAMIDNIVVNKTFMPDQQGDATGGSVNIQTKHVPDKALVSVNSSVEYNSQTTGRDNFLSYRGGGVSAFALDSGDRALPFNSKNTVSYPFSAGSPIPVHNQAQLLDAQTKSFAPVMGTQTKSVGPNYSFGASVGDSRPVGAEGKAGLLTAFSYRQKYQSITGGERNIVSGTARDEPILIRPGRAYTEQRGTEEVLWGAMTVLGYEFNPDHSFSLLLNHNQTGVDEARRLEGGTAGVIEDTGESIRYQERGASTVQLHGEHKVAELNNTTFDWVAGYNKATQDEPDFRAFRYFRNVATDTQLFLGSEFDRPRRVFRKIEEQGPQVRGDAGVPFSVWSDLEGLLKFGAFFDSTERTFASHTFFYQSGNPALDSYTGPGDFSDIFLGPNRVGLPTNSPPGSSAIGIFVAHPNAVDVNYEGQQEILAGYTMVELPITKKLKLIGGVRLEATTLAIDVLDEPVAVLQIRPDGETFFEFLTAKQASSSLSQLDMLPAVGLVYEPLPQFFVRLNYSQTIARPTFRELAPARSYDFIGGDVFIGNQDLVISQIDNYDVRVEWFRRPGDVLAASVFYKEIENPIEQISFNISGGDRYTKRVNYPKGQLYGVEGEVRQGLDIFHEALRDFSVGVNASYIVSAVTIPDDERVRLQSGNIQTRERPLLGQPEYLFNASLLYDNPRTGTGVGLFYTMTGRALVNGQSFTDVFIPDLYQAPVDNLDFSLSQKIGKNWTVTFRAKNLTDPLVRRVYEVDWNSPAINESSFKRGREYSLGVSCTW